MDLVSKQLSLDLWSDQESYKEEDLIITDENSIAFRFLDSFFRGDLFAQDLNPDSSKYSIILRGEDYSGKTHLLKVFAKKFKCHFVDPANFSQDIIDKSIFYIIEDIDNYPDDQETILSIINFLNENCCHSIISLNDIAKFKLKDLISRLKNIFTVEIDPPSSETIKQLIIANLSKLQIKTPYRNIDFISNNCERKYKTIWKINQFIAANPKVNLVEIKRYFGL